MVADGSGAREGARPGFSPLWYLVYLGFLLFHPAFDPDTGPVHWAALVLAVVAFVPLYAAVHRGRPWALRWGPHLAVAIGMALLPLNNSAGVMLVYAAAFVGMTRPRRTAVRWFATLTALMALAGLISPIPMPWVLLTFIPSALFIWIVGTACLDEAEQEREHRHLRIEHARIEHLATVSERERLSRDLHDLLGQSLTGIVVRAQLAQRLADADPARAAAEMRQVEEVARAALTEVRATVRGWRHVAFDDELAAAADALAAAGVELVVDREHDLRLVPSAETALSLALREAVTNVVRHAHARRCTVTLRRAGGEVVLSVADDGVGGEHEEGAGLTGMRERLAALGGHVERAVAGGTALRITVPATVAT